VSAPASLPERSDVAPERAGFALWPFKIYLQETFRNEAYNRITRP